MIPISKPKRCLAGLLLATLVPLFFPTAARAADVLWTGTAGNNNWNTAGNWTGGFVPEAQYEEVGVIDNGDTAFINANLPNGTPDVAGLVLGQAAASFGGLEVRSGGSIDFVASSGAPDGSMTVGLDGAGALNVLPGGSTTGASLTVNGQSSVTVGGTTAGAASMVIGGPVNLNGTARMIGAGHTFSGTSIGLGGGGTLVAQITSGTHSPIRSTGGATIDGEFRLEFGGGYSPTAGNTWNLVDAAAINGAFTNLDFSAVPAPGPGTAYQIATVPGGVNGQLLQLQLSRRLVLTVNTSTNAVSMSSPSGTSINIDGYSILSSTNGAPNERPQWNSLKDQGLVGWDESPPTSIALSELNFNIGGSLTVGTSAVNLGTPYTTATFGQAPDIRFQYTSPTNEIVDGIVEYIGNATANNLLLTVDPTSGNAQLQNSSKTTLQLVGYSILSESGSLLPGNGNWLSLDDQNVGSWLEANPTANGLNEFYGGAGATTLSPGQALNLGSPFNEAGGEQDLVLQFALNGELTPRFGVVQYGAISAAIPGDYNGDDTVDAADYVLWRKNPGAFGGSPAGYNSWRTNFGRTSGGGAGGATAGVPEPAAWSLVIVGAVGAAAAWGARRRREEGVVG